MQNKLLPHSHPETFLGFSFNSTEFVVPWKENYKLGKTCSFLADEKIFLQHVFLQERRSDREAENITYDRETENINNLGPLPSEDYPVETAQIMHDFDHT